MRNASLDTMPDTSRQPVVRAAARRTTARTWGMSYDFNSRPTAYISIFSAKARTNKSRPTNSASRSWTGPSIARPLGSTVLASIGTLASRSRSRHRPMASKFSIARPIGSITP